MSTNSHGHGSAARWPEMTGRRALLIVIVAVLMLAAYVGWRLRDDPGAAPRPLDATPTAANIARGAYLAKAGDCMACHTTRGGLPYAGGRALETPFGTVIAPNITPDPDTGIGSWSAQDFWQALHNGKSKNGRLLYPAFPYTNYTLVTRSDSDALYAYLQSVKPQRQANLPHLLHFPYNQQWALAAWRVLYFRPASYVSEPARSISWNRGAYLVGGLGHCAACHSSRNMLGAVDGALSGGLIPVLGWYAPSLTSDAEAGLGSWDKQDIVQLLHTGVSRRATVFGPMAEVVQASLQHLDDGDIAAMADYLKALPSEPVEPEDIASGPRVQALLEQGKKLYTSHCMECHGKNGEGKPPAYPPLAGNRALTMVSAVNPIRIVLNGGFPPGTKGNPRPYGMPPYSHMMSDEDVAAVVSYLRASWGNKASPVSAEDVNAYRSIPLD